ncbi:MAG: Lactonase, 7-bladed beta-propeller [Chloroflexi bacterium OLB15]|nr:MAG: Lactonase, 7-bladed beta-propeller [Chloroflexi bacterium OLB15]
MRGNKRRIIRPQHPQIKNSRQTVSMMRPIRTFGRVARVSPRASIITRMRTNRSASKMKRIIGAGLFLALLAFCLLLPGKQPLPAIAQTVSTSTPLPLFALPNANFEPGYVSQSLALMPSDGRTIVAANMLSDSITIFAPVLDLIYAEVDVGSEPRAVAITPDSRRAVVANHGDNTLSIVNLENFAEAFVERTVDLGGVGAVSVVAGDNALAYVALQISGEIVGINLLTGQITTRIPTPPMPTGLALWGEFIYVTHFQSGEFSLIYLPQGRVAQTVSTGVDSGISAAVALDITRGMVYLPQTQLNTSAANLTYDRIAQPVVSVLNLREMQAQPAEQINLTTAGRPVNMPFAVALDRFSRRLYVANAGSNDVSVVDLNTGFVRGHVDVGTNPRGLLLNVDHSRLYVHNVLENTVSVVNPNTLEVLENYPISQVAVPADELIGQTYFNSASNPLMAAGSAVSCATCHFDGLSDGRVWHGFGDEPLNTPVLFGLPETPPYRWDGSWDELADIEIKIRGWQAGTGLITDMPSPLEHSNIHAGLSPELDALTNYLIALTPPQNLNVLDAAQVQRGQEVFETQNCSSCHVGTVGTDLNIYDVGTGGGFDTPSLRWLWLSAPYFHDGSAETLAEVFELPGEHQLIFEVAPDDIDALVQFLLSLPAS